MALSPLESFVYTRDWTKPADFPTFEDDETVVRADMQFQPNELKTFINNVLVSFINTELIPLVDSLVSGTITPDSVYTAAIQKAAVTLEKLASDVTAKALGAPDKVNGVAADASGNITVTAEKIPMGVSDATTIPEAIAGAANATDSGDGNIVVAGAAAQTAMRFLQSIIFPGLDFKFINPLHSGTHADPYGIKVGSGESLVGAINALTEPGIYTVYQNRASTDVPDGAKAINSSLRGIACLSQINKHYAFIFMVDQGSNFYIQYVQSDVGGGWKQMLPDGTGVITEAKIAPDAVTAEKIADKTVGVAQLTNEARFGTELAISTPGSTPDLAWGNALVWVWGTSMTIKLTAEVSALLPPNWQTRLFANDPFTFEWEGIGTPINVAKGQTESATGSIAVPAKKYIDLKKISDSIWIISGTYAERMIYTGTSETPPAEWQPGDIYLRYSV